MSNVKRYGNFDASVDCNGKVLQLIVHESIDGKYVLFTDYCADYERLRDALQALYEETADYIRINNLGDVHHNRSMQMAREALNPPPAAGDARENDGTAAARKEKEQAGSLEEADAPKAARKDKE